MKAIAPVLALLGAVASLLAQGRVNFMNSSATLISAGGAAMPPASTRQFIFAVFLAPSDTVNDIGQTVSFDDPRFQLAGAYNTNHPTTVGRLVIRNGVDVTSAGGNPNDFGPGSIVDFVVRGWSADAGATWAEALESYHRGLFNIFIGSSTVGNDFIVGGGPVPSFTLFGIGPNQVGGFNMALVNICLGPCLMPPVRIYPASNQTVNRGGDVIFSASVYACPPTERYSWAHNGVAIPNATKKFLQITNAQATDSGDYQVVVENPCDGFPHSLDAWARLTVLIPPSSQTVETGARVHLAVRAFGDQPQAYRWLFNGSTVLSGATNSVLELENVQPPQSGSYAVVVTNAGVVVTSAPAMLNVIAPVERRLVPGVTLLGEVGSYLALDYTTNLGTGSNWLPMDSVSLGSTSQLYFDLSTPLPPQRFYRAWQTAIPTNPPSLGLTMIPALSLTGNLGDKVRVDGINAIGTTDAWFTLDTVMLTNTSQLYFDVSALGQPARLYRLVPVP